MESHDRDNTETSEQVHSEEKESSNNILSKMCTNPICLASLNISELTRNETKLSEILKGLMRLKDKVHQADDKTKETILFANAHTLDAFFSKMLLNFSHSKYFEQSLEYANLALKIQEQIRRTVLAIDQIQNPKQQIKQTNIAAVQQLNNNLQSLNVQNKLVDTEEDIKNEKGTEALDSRTKEETIGALEGIGDLEMLYRPKDT